MENIKLRNNMIQATIDGSDIFIPLSPSNRHYEQVITIVGDIPLDSGDYDWVDNAWVKIEHAITSDMVNTERNRRLALPFEFEGNIYDRDERSLARITGAATLAGFYLANPANDPTSVFWHGGQTPFTWITATNTVVQLSALQTFMMGRAAANRESFLIFKGKEIKDMQPIPQDYTDDSWWT